ncbi:hypothetical protein CC1G_03328 [Coprinopsis cinerea okayama7|uniref:Uncharacterized protein n=1 Tax=Coprinopsis cinerea (strain Okayama-7 / 130 / ATCC MYA-4618 / FGSC 9003) TaxID=240176 RepID=A8N7I5_COPC7|nr:hypothetical protein CC1G_03328 [Coprinopsis cinerea okayama7\|eukprot:XP_001830791.2 hypothetical protein CC1G_03328 [Coprinopsis cinerea okayama7\
MSSTDGVVCSEADRLRASQDASQIHCLTRGESLGVMLIAETGVLSLLAVIYVFGIIIRNIFRRRRLSEEWKVFEEPTDLLLASLFAIDGIQAVGAIINVVWLHRGKVETGPFCEAQGIFKQYGEVGVAFNTILIALYTFIALWGGRKIRSMLKTAILVFLAWLAPLILVLIGNLTTQDFHGPVPLWCWITKRHPVWRIMGEYLWMWLGLAICILMYIPIYFWNRGNFVPQDKWWKVRVRSTRCSPIDSELRRKASIMLLYPLAYSIVVLPLSIIRWITFDREKKGYSEPTMATAATVLAGVLFASSGFLNVILYLRTRPDTALFGGRYREGPRLPSTVGGPRTSTWSAKPSRSISDSPASYICPDDRDSELDDFGRAPPSITR